MDKVPFFTSFNLELNFTLHLFNFLPVMNLEVHLALNNVQFIKLIFNLLPLGLQLKMVGFEQFSDDLLFTKGTQIGQIVT